MNAITDIEQAPDYTAIKTKQNAAWSSGDYAKIGVTLQVVGEDLAEAMDLPPAASVLDVAAGNGNATLAFARRWADVLGLPLEPLDDGYRIQLDPGHLRFVPDRDGRGDGVRAVDFAAEEPDTARSAARARGLLDDDGEIRIAGTRLRLV